MGNTGEFIHDNPIKVIIVVLLLLMFPISHIPQIKIDTSTEGFMHKDDPVLLNYNTFRAQFGRDEKIAVAIKSDNIFTIDFLNKLKALHEDIEKNVPYINDVTSLYNVRNTRGDGDLLITDDLLEPMPKNQKEVDNIKKRAMESHFYKDLLISKDGKMTVIVIETDAYSHIGEKKVSIEDEFADGFEESETNNSKERVFLSDMENKELLDKLYNVIKKYQKDGLEIYIAGSPAVNNALKAQMRADIQKFTKITFLIIIIFLFIIFKRASAIFYPLLVIIFSLLTTIGTMAWAGVAFKLPTQIVPSLLLAVSVGATVHILSIFFDRFNNKGSRKDAIIFTMKHSGLAIAMTSITTAIGIGSFTGSKVAPISDLGTFASLGVMVSLFLTLTLLPALLSITKLKARPQVTHKSSKLDNIMKQLALIPIKYHKIIIIISGLLVLIAIYSASKIELSHNPLIWFQKDNFNRISTETIDKIMNGTVTIEVTIDTKTTNGWNDPQRLDKLNKLSAKLETYTDKYTHIGKVVSLATIVKETNRALHSNQESYYKIPKNADLVSQELLLFENSGSDDLEDVVDSQFSKVRVTIKLPWTDAVKACKVLEYVKSEVKTTFKNEEVIITGMVPLLINTFAQSVNSSVESYIIAFIGITLTMMIILGSVRIGLISMIPNLVPIILGLLIMYIMNIPLDMFTLLIGSIAIGLAVDDTIHFMHNFKRYYLQTKDSAKAIKETFFTTGKAMLITSIVLSLAFLSYMQGEMIAVQNFGFLTGCVIILALIADLLLAPSLMIVITKWGWIK